MSPRPNPLRRPGCAAAQPTSWRCGWPAVPVPSPLPSRLAAQSLLLVSRHLCATGLTQIEQGGQLVAREDTRLAGALNLNKIAVAGADDVHVDLGPDILVVTQIQAHLAVDDAHRHRRDRTMDG